MTVDEHFRMKMDIKTGDNICPKCGSDDLGVDVGSGRLMCMFCHTFIDEEKINGRSDIVGLEDDTYSVGADKMEANQQHVMSFECPNCREQVTFDANEVSTARCPWCRHIFVNTEQIPNGKMPDLVLPFSYKKQDAIKNINDFVAKHRRYAHPDFKKQYDANNVVGVYLPYMIVDVHGKVKLSGVGEKEIRSYWEKRGEHSEKVYDVDRYRVKRDFDIAIDDLTIEASADKFKQDMSINTSNIVNSVMPFDTENCVKWTPYHLRGFSADKRDIEANDLYDPIKKQSYDIAITKGLETATDYDRGVYWEDAELTMEGTSWKFAQMPIWLYSYYEKYPHDQGGILHYVAVNARNGKTMGSVPIYRPKLKRHAFALELVTGTLGVLWMIYLFADDPELRFGLGFILGFLPGFIFYFAIRSKYRNENVRFKHETDTRSDIHNLVASDTKIETITGTERTDIGQKNKLHGVNIHNTTILDKAIKAAEEAEKEKE